MNELTDLPNIGEILAEKLYAIGVNSREDLVAKGSVEAVLEIGEPDQSACYNMLYALEGAIRGVRWHAISKEERSMFKEEYDAARAR
ncbi:MAG: TfoX/Sxy family DNA transformation protein [Anaerolineales bacterium]